MVSVFVWEPENLEGIIKQCAYVVYPPEGPKPPSQDEMRKIIEANRKKRLD
jgi:protein PET100